MIPPFRDDLADAVHGASDGQFALLFGDVKLQLLARFHRRQRAEPHLADELDALLCLAIEFKYEAKDVARIDEANNDDVSRIGNLVHKDSPADPRSNELTFRLLGSTSQSPELAVVVF